MKFKPKLFFATFAILMTLGGWFLYPLFQKEIPPQELVKKQLVVSALSPQSFWSQEFLDGNEVLKAKIVQFEQGSLCKSLKGLNTRKLTHKQILIQLKEFGYKCIVRPLAVNPAVLSLSYLKVDKTTTQNPQEPGVAHQEICQDPTQPACVIRIKKDGFPLNRRSNPHSTKAVLMDPQGDAGDYYNEAFKIGADGQALPKGPKGEFGLRKCPYHKDKELCEQWVDLIMEEAHPALREPVGTGVLNP